MRDTFAAAPSAPSDTSGTPDTSRRPQGSWQIMSAVRGRIGLAMGLSGLGASFGLAGLALLARVVADLGDKPERWPWQALAGAAACMSAAYALRLAAFNRSHHAAFHLEAVLRTRLSEHLARMPLGDVQQLGTGALSKVMQDDVKALHIFVADSTPLYARAYVTPLVTLAALLWLDWRLALAAVGVLAFGFGLLALAMRDHGAMMRVYNQARERVSAAVIEFVQAMPVVRTFDTGHATFGRYEQALSAYLDVLRAWYRRASFGARFSMALLGPLPTLLALLGLGLWLGWHDALPFSTWLAALLLGTGMAESMMPLMILNHMVEKTRLSIGRIQQVLEMPAMPMPTRQAARRPLDASVVFEDVSFGYGTGGRRALSHVSFTAAPGTVTALVGPSGAGKTTVARLIPRFWDASAGRVLVGGVDVREMDGHTLMGHVAFVFQDSFLFAGSVADNIRLGMETAPMDAVIAAARAAQAHDFISALPQGYDTPVGERGTFLSGGQRQRIAIARALMQDRPILVLDEATAFADPEGEAALVVALSALMRGRTVIMVAHRLSTVRDADQILVFEGGRLVEAGRHESMLADRHGVYAGLWSSHEQAQGWAMGARSPSPQRPDETAA